MALRAKLLSLLLLLALSAIPDVADGSAFTPDQEASLLAFVNNLMACRGITGLTLAVVRGNDTWTRGFGVADREAGRNVTNTTLFGIGSITKAFTTTMLYHLLDQSNRYSWESLMVDILGDQFRMVNDDLTHLVTLKDLLVHRTGLASSDIPLFANLPDSVTPAHFAERLRYLPAEKKFRDVFQYNNWMYGLAGHVVEVLSGTTWENQLNTTILQPIGMVDTRVLGKTITVEASNMARPYVQVGDEVVLSDPKVYSITPQEAAGAIASSAVDMAKWLQHLLNANKTFTDAVMSPYISVPSTFTGRHAIWKPDFPITFATFSYGYGWFLGVYRGHRTIFHSGGFYAYISYNAMIPDIGLGVFVSTNGPGGINASTINRQIFYFIADLALGEEPWLNLTNACDFPQLWVNRTQAEEDNATVPSGDIFQHADRFAGSYGHLLFGIIEVTRNGSDGRLAVKFNRLEGRLLTIDAADNTALMEVSGALSFLSHPGSNKTLYFNFTFTGPSSQRQGQYQALQISAADMGEKDVLVFRRGLKYSDFDPNGGGTSGAACGVGAGGGGCGFSGVLAVCLSAVTAVFLIGVQGFFVSLV